MRRAGATVLTAMVASLLFTAAPARADEEPPSVTNPSTTPGFLPYTGGTVTISADVVDEDGIQSVGADASGSNGVYLTVELLPTGSGDTYSATLDIPANFTDESVPYTVLITAEDKTGRSWVEGAGGPEVAAQPQFDEPPAVSDPSVTPLSLPAAGGPVTIAATATDDQSISEVYAAITLPGGGFATVTLDAISSTRFEGVYTAPANAGATPATYGVGITATDDVGQSDSIDAGDFTVAAAAPPAALLRLSPTTQSFGTMRLGGRVNRVFRLRNVGPRSAAPVSGIISISGAPFSLVGARPARLFFQLAGQQTKTFVVQFKPGILGPQSGTLRVARSDGAQPGLSSSLTGVGRKRG